MSLLIVALFFLWPPLSGCDTAVQPPTAVPNAPSTGDELTTPVVQHRLMTRMYGMGGLPMRRGLVVFGERVLVVAHPLDDHTPQHIVVVDATGQSRYLREDGSFQPVPESPERLLQPAILRGEGLLADYADGVLVLLNSDSLSEWTDSGFLDWGEGTIPTGEPSQWSTRIPLIVRESHQLTVGVLGRGATGAPSLMVGHVSRKYKDTQGQQPVHFPAAMISTDRGRSWSWSPEFPDLPRPAGAYAAAWPDAPGGSALLYFVSTLPGDDTTPPLAIFRPDASSSTGVTVDVPYRSRTELWNGHQYRTSGRSFVPHPVRHWVTRKGLIVETTTQGLFWMDHPDRLPRPLASPKQTLDAIDRTLYFASDDELMRVLPSGAIQRLVDPEQNLWTLSGEIERPEGVRWIQAAASEEGALWLLGLMGSPTDVSIATWAPGTAF